MIVRKFLQWVQTASASQRADGASALARAYLYADLDPEQKDEAEQALTSLLDDPSPLVRRALAESFASAVEAPHHIILALADDQSDISSIVLGRSPLLTDSELIDCAAIGDTFAQSAIALRLRLSPPVAAALAEIGGCEALISLAINPGADLPEFSMHRMVERFGGDGELREALLSRPYLPPALRSDLVAATSKALLAFVTGCDWIPAERAERAAREACEKANVIIAVASEAEAGGPRKLVEHLCASGQLTAGLILRALLSGNMSLFEAALCELSGLPVKRVRGLAADWASAGFAALYRKAGLPEKLLPAFRAALDAMSVCGPDITGSARLSRQMVERVLTACETAPRGGFEDKLFAVLRRFEAEAAREDARLDAPAFLQEEVASAVPPVVVLDEHAGEAEIAAAASPVLALNGGSENDRNGAPIADTREIEELIIDALSIDAHAADAPAADVPMIDVQMIIDEPIVATSSIDMPLLDTAVAEVSVIDASVPEAQVPVVEALSGKISVEVRKPRPSYAIDLDELEAELLAA